MRGEGKKKRRDDLREEKRGEGKKKRERKEKKRGEIKFLRMARLSTKKVYS